MISIRSLAFRGALVASLASMGAAAAIAAVPSADRPKPAAVETIASMRVEEYGSGSPAMVFVPGLSCGSWVWDDAVRRYAKTHAVYVVTLPGFDGVPAVKPASGSRLDAADASLLALITQKHLDRPILVGHSMGGFLVIRFGTEHSDLVRGIVAVDGLPVFPTLVDTPPERRKVVADATDASLAGLSADDYAKAQTDVISGMVTDPAMVPRVAALTAKADPAAVGAFAGALFASDVRPQLSKLTAPTMEIAPVPTEPTAFEGPQAAKAGPDARAESYRTFYASLFPDAPHVTVVPIANSRHFVMVDQPAALYDRIDAFIATLQ